MAFETRGAIAKCLHPDYDPTAAERTKAFKLFSAWTAAGKKAARRPGA